MNKTILKQFNEEVFSFMCPSGLKVILLPKPDFSRTTVSIQINSGSIDKTIVKDNKKIVFHDGVAHFLEHMIFENTSKDIPKAFSSLGASVNAYTTTNKTVYYFSTVEDYIAPLKLLLEIIFQPDFDQNQIEKERTIIKSEIQMYQDDLEQSLYYDTMKLMYINHPIRSDIAGSKEEVDQITKEELMIAFNSFYQPSNAFITISGNVDASRIETALKEFSFASESNMIHPYRVLFEEEKAVFEDKELYAQKDMMNAFVMMGLKIDPTNKSIFELALLEFKYLLIFDNFFSKSSDYLEVLTSAKLINNTFDFSVTIDQSYGHVLFFTETSKPKRLVSTLKEMITSMKDKEIDIDRFNIQKRKIIGQLIQLFNSPSDAAHLISDYDFKDIKIDLLLEEIYHFTIEEITQKKNEIDTSSIIDVIYETSHKNRKDY